jgi:hypothetical protein
MPLIPILSMNRGFGLRTRQPTRESGIGLLHSTTSRKEWRAGMRDSVVECGSPMPLVPGACEPSVRNSFHDSAQIILWGYDRECQVGQSTDAIAENHWMRLASLTIPAERR